MKRTGSLGLISSRQEQFERVNITPTHRWDPESNKMTRIRRDQPNRFKENLYKTEMRQRLSPIYRSNEPWQKNWKSNSGTSKQSYQAT